MKYPIPELAATISLTTISTIATVRLARRPAAI